MGCLSLCINLHVLYNHNNFSTLTFPSVFAPPNFVHSVSVHIAPCPLCVSHIHACLTAADCVHLTSAVVALKNRC